MKRFSDLFDTLDQTTSTLAKVDALARYFSDAPAEDAAWAVYLLSGQRLQRLVARPALLHWLQQASALPAWLVDDAQNNVGDLAETIALLMANPNANTSHHHRSNEWQHMRLSEWLEHHLLPLRNLSEPEQGERVMAWWRALPRAQCFLLNKLLTGGFRVGVSRLLVARALAQVAAVPEAVMQHRLMGRWQPSANAYRALLDPDTQADLDARPYPFFLASLLEKPVDSLGECTQWFAEWKWDGIRAQLIKRGGACYIWSRGEELVTERYPEVAEAAQHLPDGTVLDGELLVWRDGVRPFAELQKRIGRKRVSANLLRDYPVHLLAYDCLEHQGEDLRTEPLRTRRARLQTLVQQTLGSIQCPPPVAADSWQQLAEARETSRSHGVEGVMLKAADSPYLAGRKRGHWWKWKLAPLTLDAVMIYAQAGRGRRASLCTDYTFALWHEEELVPIAKAYSGLTDEEIRRLDRWIRQHTQERFGPVRVVPPEQVFEIAFEGINLSNRHKSGLALRFPRIARWRDDLTPDQADSLDDAKRLLAVVSG